MKKIILVVILSFIILLSKAQKLEFRDVKIIKDNQKTVYFQIKGLGENENERNYLLEKLLSDPKIQDGRIFTSSTFKTRCQLFLDMDVEPEYIRKILVTNGYDFEFSSVSIDGKILESAQNNILSPFYYPSKDFPKPLYTGDKMCDEEIYNQVKQEWINNNKKKYKKECQEGTAKIPIIISKEQFDSFTSEKQAKILSQPEIYVIK